MKTRKLMAQNAALTRDLLESAAYDLANLSPESLRVNKVQETAESKRSSQPTRIKDGVRILDLETYAPFLLTAVNNAWQRRTSADYRARFGLGVVEWRVLAMLNIEAGITANRVCEVIRMDKAAASRALTNLVEKDLIVHEAEKTDPRKRRWWLSEKGQKTHSEILSAAMSHEAELTEGIPDENFEVFLEVMRRMLKNLDS